MKNLLLLAAAAGLALSLTAAPTFAQNHQSGSSSAAEHQQASGNQSGSGDNVNCASVLAQQNRYGPHDLRGCSAY